MHKVPISICGVGTVGTAVINLLNELGPTLESKYNLALPLVEVGARRDKLDCDIGSATIEKDIFKVADNPNSQILIELIGGVDDAYELTLRAFRAKKTVITANKALIAAKGNELFREARANNVGYLYEASVAGGIPIIKVMQEGLAANKISHIAGIINGTCNYILTAMTEKGTSYEGALKKAQELGYAEAEPSFDVDGIDAAHKLAILASLAFACPLSYQHIYTEGIREVDIQDINAAGDLGFVMKHLAIAEYIRSGTSSKSDGDKISLRVHPTLVHKEDAIGAVNGVINGIMIDSFPLGRTFYSGAGAGGEATASAVLADLLDASQALASHGVAPKTSIAPLPGGTGDKLEFMGIEDVHSEFYLRVNVEDQPGVLAKITDILSQLNISIEGITQKESHDHNMPVPIFIITHSTKEKDIDRAIEQIGKLPQVRNKITKLRILTSDKL